MADVSRTISLPIAFTVTGSDFESIVQFSESWLRADGVANPNHAATSGNCRGVERSRYTACLQAVGTFHSIPLPFFPLFPQIFPRVTIFEKFENSRRSRWGTPLKRSSSVRVMKRKNRATVTIGRSTLTCILLCSLCPFPHKTFIALPNFHERSFHRNVCFPFLTS